jgi:hypothetical protein
LVGYHLVLEGLVFGQNLVVADPLVILVYQLVFVAQLELGVYSDSLWAV